MKSDGDSMNANIWAGGTGDPIRYKIVKNNDHSGTYYDEGFVTKYGSSGVSRMKEATRAVQEFYRDAFGLWMTIPEPIKMTSQMDICLI